MCLQKSSADFRQDTHQSNYRPSDMVGNHGAQRNPHGQQEQDAALIGCYSNTYQQTPSSRGQTTAGLIPLELAALISKAGHSVSSLQTSFITYDICTICGRRSWMVEYASISVTLASGWGCLSDHKNLIIVRFLQSSDYSGDHASTMM